MVSQSSAPPASRDRVFAAAAAEFAARGFDGAKVDRIAARARLNKAMLYYHFRGKAALYRAVLDDMFSATAEAVAAVRAAGGAPDAQLRAFIHTVAAAGLTRPHFAPIWLRELAEGGRHVDVQIARHMGRVVQVLAEILAEGQRAGRFRPVPALVVQMSIVAPLLLFIATAGARERLGRALPQVSKAPDIDGMVAFVQQAALASLAPETTVSERPARRRK